MRRNPLLLLLTLALLLAVADASAQTPADRQRARIQSRLGWEHMRAEQWAQAAEAFRRATELDPGYEYAHYSLGRAELARRRFPAAIAALERCRNLHQAQAGRRFSSAQDAQQYRRDRLIEIDEQIRLLQTGRQTQQTNELIRQLQNVRRDIQDSIERGTSMTIEGGVPAYVTLSLGSAYFRAGRFADAEREYKATVATDPKSGEAYSNLAVVYLETGRYAEAHQAVESARRVGFRVNPQLEEAIRLKRRTGW